MAVRNPASTRPWQHVLDPLIGYLSTLEAILGGEEISSVNFGPDTQSLAVSEVVEVAVKTWGLSTNIELGSSVQNNPAESVSLDLNPDYAKQSLGWEPCWSQEEAVISTVQWWNKVLNQGVKSVDACLDDLSQILSQK
jgi:CDP-glucose 4,6-dehydratase